MKKKVFCASVIFSLSHANMCKWLKKHWVLVHISAQNEMITIACYALWAIPPTKLHDCPFIILYYREENQFNQKVKWRTTQASKYRISHSLLDY